MDRESLSVRMPTLHREGHCSERLSFGRNAGLPEPASMRVFQMRFQILSVPARELIISGQAGIGKSHLVADFGAMQLEFARPFVLVLTGTLTESDPWEQIRGQLDLGRR